MSNESVSYVVPMYNGREFIREFLSSIRAQCHRPLELVLVDDGSTDGSASEVEAQREVMRRSGIALSLINQINSGTSAARNSGLRVATGKWIGFVDVDDLLPVRRTRWLLQAALDSRAELAYGRTLRFTDIPTWPVEESDPIGSIPVTVGDQLIKCVPGQTQFLAKRSLLDRVGGYNQELRMVDEFEFIVRLRAANPRMVRIERVVYGYRQRAGSNTSRGALVRLPWSLRSHELMLESLLASGRDEERSREILRRLFLRDARQALWLGNATILRRSVTGLQQVVNGAERVLLGPLGEIAKWDSIVRISSSLVRLGTTRKISLL